MRRRQAAEAAPSRLTAFDRADWPTDSLEESFAIWRRARQAWADEHGGWPGGPIAMLRQELSARRALYRGTGTGS